MAKREHVWTKKEKEWLERLKGDNTYELVTLEESYNRAPPSQAYDLVKEKYGDACTIAWCLFYMLHLATEVMEDAVFLCHAPLNCMSCSQNFHTQLCQNYGCAGHPNPSVALDKRHIIFGGEEALYDAILAADRDYKPKLIVISTGCAPGLIQDDCARVAEQAQSQVKAKVMFVPTSGYETTAYQLGTMIHRVVTPWVDLMEPPKKVDKKAVNILGNTRELYYKRVCGDGDRERRYPSDVDELGRYIEALGLRVHRVLLGGDYDYIRTAPEAGYNTIYCGTWGFPMAEAMEKKFGTPWVRHELPLGIESTSRWIMDLAKLTGREEAAEKLIKAETEAIKDVYERAKEAVAGKAMIIGGVSNRAFSWLRFAEELGMEVIWLAAYPEFGQAYMEPVLKDKYWDTEYFLDYGFNPLVLALKKHKDRPLNVSDLSLWKVRERLGIAEDEAIYTFCDFSTFARAGILDPSSTPYHLGSTHLHRRVGCTSRACGFTGTRAWCEELIEDVKAAERKASPTLLGRVHGKYTFNFEA